MNMIPLSVFIPELVNQHHYYTIRGITSNNEVYDLSSGNISEFYNNIFIEKLLSRQFKKITIETTYKFNYVSGDEKINNKSITELVLIDSGSRVYIKNVYTMLIYKNKNFENNFKNIFNKYKDTYYEFICLEQELETINSNNQRKPIKIECSNYHYNLFNSHSNDRKYVSRNIEDFIFDIAEKITLPYHYTFFGKYHLIKNKINLSCSDMKKKLNTISKYVTGLNNSMTQTLSDRKTIRLLNKLIYDPCSKFPIQIKFNNEEFDFKSILKIGRFLEKEYEEDNSHLSNFWELIQSVINPGSASNYNYYNEIRKLFTEVNLYSIVGQEISIDKDKIILLFNTKTNNNLKLLHLIYSEELEIKLEKVLLTTRG